MSKTNPTYLHVRCNGSSIYLLTNLIYSTSLGIKPLLLIHGAGFTLNLYILKKNIVNVATNKSGIQNTAEGLKAAYDDKD